MKTTETVIQGKAKLNIKVKTNKTKGKEEQKKLNTQKAAVF